MKRIDLKIGERVTIKGVEYIRSDGETVIPVELAERIDRNVPKNVRIKAGEPGWNEMMELIHANIAGKLLREFK